MYELSIAAKYLTPRWRQLSVSIISLISILVISVVVWLIIVFFSVTTGLTNGWLDKLTSLTAPVRITPTKEYYQSYYYLVDGISSDSDYTLKTITEKRNSEQTDPHDPSVDEEIPFSWRKPDKLADGSLKDLVKLALASVDNIAGVAGLKATEYENGIGNLHLRVWRPQKKELPTLQKKNQNQGFISQSAFVGSMDGGNPWLYKTVMAPTIDDLSNLLHNLAYENDSFEHGESLSLSSADFRLFQERLKSFFSHISIDQLKTPETGWALPTDMLPSKARWDVVAMMHDGEIKRLILPHDASAVPKHLQFKASADEQVAAGKLTIDGGSYTLQLSGQEALTLTSLPRLIVPGEVKISAELMPGSIEHAHKPSELLFRADLTIQKIPLSGTIRYSTLEIGHAQTVRQFDSTPLHTPLWAYILRTPTESTMNLPLQRSFGEGVLLPRGFRESGALLGDTGYIAYHAPSPTGVHEQKIPFFVAGFYDPGIIPIGGKYILANPSITNLIRASYNQEENLSGNGINVRFEEREQADKVKSELLKAFKSAGIEDYWNVETFREYEFTRDVIQQLQSDKHLFSLLAALIIIVACSNIISMLIILVNDKKTEIGILRSMGASSLSIAAIFGSCGIFIGVVGSLTGTLAAILTLKNLQPIVNFISWIQGYEMFNPIFYGENLPTDLSVETLTAVIIATAIISLVSGLIPAIKASLLKPSAILKAE